MDSCDIKNKLKKLMAHTKYMKYYIFHFDQKRKKKIISEKYLKEEKREAIVSLGQLGF